MTEILVFSRRSEVSEPVKAAIVEMQKMIPDVPVTMVPLEGFVAKTPPPNLEKPCVVIADADLDGSQLNDLLAQANKIAAKNKFQARLFVAGSEKGGDFRKKLAGIGVRDYWVSPLDPALIAMCLRFWMKPNSANLELVPAANDAFQIQCELSAQCEISQISEFGVQVRTDKSFIVNEMLWIQFPGGDAIKEFKEPFLGRVYNVVEKKEKSEDPLKFTISLAFLGIPDNVLKEIRNWIRREYAKSKQND